MRPIMLNIRRYGLYLAIVAFVVCTLRLLDLISPAPSYTPKSAEVHGDIAGAQFQWSALPTKFALQSQLLPLPTGRPRKLPSLQSKSADEAPLLTQQAATRRERQAAVRATFQRCWSAYKKDAWMHDELLPLSRQPSDKLGGWGATLVENLDTLWIMGFTSDFNEAVDAVTRIDTRAIKTEYVNVKRTTIRYLGGLLSAYDLSGKPQLLKKAREFGEMLLKAFDTPNHLPVTRWNWQSAMNGEAQQASNMTLLAEMGSLSLEFTRLSQLTGDARWYSAVHSMTLLFEAQLHKSLLPGMFPVSVDASGELDVRTDNRFTLNKWADSFYEYLPKMHLPLGGLERTYERLYVTTMATAVQYTIFRPMTLRGEDILFPGSILVLQNDRVETTLNVQHLGCFAGGMFAMGGTLFGNRTHFEIGKQLTYGCAWAYQTSASGVMTEQFHMTPCPDLRICSWDETRYRESIENLFGGVDVDVFIQQNRLRDGITWFEDTRYHLRPEAIESVFLLYRMTGNTTYQDIAWTMYESIMNITTSEEANAAVLDVTYTREEMLSSGVNHQLDSMESFWLTETLKYFYLIFSEPDLVSLDEYVFNTEGHPLRRPSDELQS